jgi:hypothetical protein
MNKLLVKWLEALESGKYGQRKLVLHGEGNKYCCFGVLCEVAEWKWNSEVNGYKGPNESVLNRELPLELIDEVFDKTGTYNFVGDKLSNMNDSGVTFKKIAKFIRKNIDEKGRWVNEVGD